jgi:hypothetical protein
MRGSFFRCLAKVVFRARDGKYSYRWHYMTFFSKWTSKRSIVLCLGVPSTFTSGLESILARRSITQTVNLYCMYVPIFELIIDIYDRSIWRIRDAVKRVEAICPGVILPYISTGILFREIIVGIQAL